jgi:hypothetical protein
LTAVRASSAKAFAEGMRLDARKKTRREEDEQGGATIVRKVRDRSRLYPYNQCLYRLKSFGS